MENLKIERLNKNEMSILMAWSTREGWNPGLHDEDCFYVTDPKGFFVGKTNDQIVAVGSAVVYDEHFAFSGLYIVKPEHRGKNYGIQLTKARLEYLGDRIAGLDGLLNMVDKFKRLGYVIAHYNQRYTTNKIIDFKIHKNIIDMTQIPFSKLAEYDQKYFPAKRPTFLKCWIQQPDSFSLGYMEADQLTGYGVIRKCQHGHKIGPLFAESAVIADHIFQALMAKVAPSVCYLDIPEPNKNAIMLIDKYAMKKSFATARMYRNGKPNLELTKIYAITTLELG